MPRISCLGRKWSFASDDLVYPGIIELIANTAWLTVMIVVFVSSPPVESSECPINSELKNYYFMMIATLSVSEFLVIIAILLSSRGTIMDDSPRRFLGPLLMMRAVVRITEFGFNVYAATFVFKPVFNDSYKNCSDSSLPAFITARVSVIADFMLAAGLLTLLAILYDPLGRARVQGDMIKFEERARTMYRKRINCCLYLCARAKLSDSVDRSRVEAFSSVAEYLAEFFETDDLAASDVLAGLLLLGKQHRSIGLTTVRHGQAPLGTPVASIQSTSEMHGLLVAHGVANWPAQLQDLPRKRVKFNLHLNAKGKPHVLPDNEGMKVLKDLDWLDLRVMRRVLQFATGIYGWLFYSVKHRPTNVLCSFVPNLRCCSCCCCCPAAGRSLFRPFNYGNIPAHSLPSYVQLRPKFADVESGLDVKLVVGDNCCQCNLVAFLLETGLRREDVLYASWVESGLHRVAFAVVVDHALRSVVIVVRGTLSVGDVLTDIGFDLARLTAPSASFEDFLDAPNHHPFFQPSSGLHSEDTANNATADRNAKSNDDDEIDSEGRRVYLVHSGIMHAAMRVRRRIEELGLLEAAFRKYPTYKLIITGHSLGAGVTTLLGWSYAATAYRKAMSQSTGTASQSPLDAALSQLVCFAFAPPCGLVSRAASEHLSYFLCSVYLGDDIVPRLSVSSINLLKNELLVVLRECKVPKYRVLAKSCWRLCCSNASTRALEVELNDSTSRLNNETASPTLHAAQSVSRSGDSPLLTTSSGYLLQQARQLDAGRQHLKVSHFPRMFAPGIIVQICAEYVNDDHSRNQLTYRLCLRSCDDLQRIVVSTNMIIHHTPMPLLSALGHLSRLVNHGEEKGVPHGAADFSQL